jgi:O-antigen/teichoic acid export membrane protein
MQVMTFKTSPAGERLLALGWSAAEGTCRQFLSLAFFFISVRFLHPYDLGVFALALAFNNVTMIFVNDMIGEALLQKATVTALDWDTGFTVNLIITIALVLGLVAVSVPIARVLHDPSLRYAIPALGFATLTGAFGAIQHAFLARTLRFERIAQTTLASQIIAGLVGLALAASGAGYWALIANVVIFSTTGAVLLWIVSPWKPRPRIDRSTITSIYAYSAYVAAIRTIYLLRDQSPLIIAGMLVDVAHVGLFSLALRIARCLGQLFEDVTSRPLLSLISRDQHDPERFGSALIEIMALVGMVALPAYCGLALVGPMLLPLVFGDVWAPAGELLPWICIALGGWLVLHITAVALRAKSSGRLAVKLTAIAALADVVMFAAAAPFGLSWMVMAWAGRSLLSIPIAVYVLQTRLGVAATSLLRRTFPALMASALMAALLVFAQRPTTFMGLALLIGGSAAVYGVAMVVIKGMGNIVGGGFHPPTG